ncbi:MAG: hypothetical protein ACKOUM_06580, partial [Sphingopyxis sp.]
ERGERGSNARGAPRTRVDTAAYIEVGQVVTGEFSGNRDVLTYSTVAVGAQAAVSTRRAQAAVDVRYERRLDWADPLADNNILTGAARGRYDIASGFAMEAGAMATRASLDGRGGTADFAAGDRSNVTNLYALYAGPTFGRRFGDLDVGAAYRFGYSRADAQASPLLAAGQTSFGQFEDSTNHALIGSVGMAPGRLPVGWRLSGGYEREDSGQLDQRYEGKHARLDLTYPITPTIALVGGVGYEDISVSYRPPVTDTAGAPVVDSRGRLVTNSAAPRQIAFETDGLIYDAGVMWRPSRRVAVEARVGRRYGDTIYTGSATWQENATTAYQLGVYDNLSTVGRQLTSGLAGLPTDFELVRNQIDGSIGGCAFGASGGNCMTPTLANATGFAFRSRGAVLSMSSRQMGWNLGAALGYDRRTYVTSGLTAIPGLNGTVDETYFAALTASHQLSERTNFGSSVYATYFDSGLANSGDTMSAGASAALSHMFLPRLSGSAAVSVNTIDQDGFNSRVFGSALFGMRYNF